MSTLHRNNRSSARAARPAGYRVVHVFLVCILAAPMLQARAQGKPIPTSAPARAPEQLRAFTGNWMNDNIIVGMTKPGVVPFRPEYEKRLVRLAKLAVAGKEVPGNEPKCIPNGPAMDMAFGMRIFADADQLLLVTGGPRLRYVWVDGRQHTPDDVLFESFDGESIAHFDGETLIVDTVGLKSSDEIVFGIPVNDDKLHIIERWTLISPSTLQIQTTIEDAVALTRPWSYTRTYSRRASASEVEYCTPALDRTRNGGFDLKPPPGGYVPPGAKQ